METQYYTLCEDDGSFGGPFDSLEAAKENAEEACEEGDGEILVLQKLGSYQKTSTKWIAA